MRQKVAEEAAPAGASVQMWEHERGEQPRERPDVQELGLTSEALMVTGRFVNLAFA